MTVTDFRAHVAPQSEPTTESEHVATLRAMLDDPAEQPNWPEIRQAIEYLTATTVLAA